MLHMHAQAQRFQIPDASAPHLSSVSKGVSHGRPACGWHGMHHPNAGIQRMRGLLEHCSRSEGVHSLLAGVLEAAEQDDPIPV